MQEFIQAVINHAFMQNAIFVSLLSSIASGLTGTFVVIKRLSYLAGGMAHATLGGMGVAYYLGYNPFIGGAIFAILASIGFSWVRFRFNQNEDTLISALWAVGMAIGILFLYKTPGYTADLHSFLFGNILMTSNKTLSILIGLDLVLICFFLFFYKQFISISFDEDFAYLKGLPVIWLYTLLLCLVAITILILVSTVGLILVIALLTLPVSTLKIYISSPGKLMGASCLLTMVLTIFGLYLSYIYNLPSGPIIIFLGGGLYIISILINTKILQLRNLKN